MLIYIHKQENTEERFRMKFTIEQASVLTGVSVERIKAAYNSKSTYQLYGMRPTFDGQWARSREYVTLDDVTSAINKHKKNAERLAKSFLEDDFKKAAHTYKELLEEENCYHASIEFAKEMERSYNKILGWFKDSQHEALYLTEDFIYPLWWKMFNEYREKHTA